MRYSISRTIRQITTATIPPTTPPAIAAELSGGRGERARREQGESEEREKEGGGEREELFIDMRHCYKYHFATKALIVLLHRKTFCCFLAPSATLEVVVLSMV